MLDVYFNFFQQHELLTLIAITVLGIMVGSFLNVVIYRLPIMLERDWREQSETFLNLPATTAKQRFNLLLPHSHCPQCKTAIKPWHNLPLISFLIMGGKSTCCGNKISWQYPLVELTAGVLAFFVTWHFGFMPTTLALLLFVFACLSLTVIDLHHQILPDVIVLPLLWLGLLLNLNHVFAPLSDAIIGASAGYLSLWSITWLFKLITGKIGMGNGDFKFLAMCGAWFGWKFLPLIVCSGALLGTIIGIGLIIFKKHKSQTPIPFGPFLALGALVAIFWGPTIIDNYLQFVMPY